MADLILSLLPPHKCYTEVFFGGGAVFFKKPISEVEIINDISDNMVNFYRVIKRNFEGLHDEIDVTLYSEFQYREARKLWLAGMGNDVLRAWAVYVLSHQSFSGNLGQSWAHSDTKNLAKKFDKEKKMFDQRYVKRLANVQIFCRDALSVLAACDGVDVFHFIDPPYFNADMGHYDGYTESDFKELLNLLETLEGKFMLTTYPSELLAEYTARNGWHTINNEMHLTASNKPGKTKTEVFTMNYKPTTQAKLF